MTLEEVIEQYPECKNYVVIIDAFTKAISILKDATNVLISVSGGSDSDICLDIVEKIKFPYNNIKYIFFDTGLELDATKKQLDVLEQKYNIQIERVKPEKNVPYCVKHYGIPFQNKFCSKIINLLQRNGFDFKQHTYPELSPQYPTAISGIKWWTNWTHSEYDTKSKHNDRFNSRDSMYNIAHNKYLKDFLMAHQGVPFTVSEKCCYYAKEKPVYKILKEYDIDLEILGLRKAEGGRRSLQKTCFLPPNKKHSYGVYSPIFWFKAEDKEDYCRIFNVVHSDAYIKYGFTRIGCVGCPYNMNILNELEIIKKYEPKKYKACINLFGKSYELMREFNEFKEEKTKNNEPQTF